jgi:hypothetical protein
MPVSPKFASDQIERFAAFPFFPDTEIAITDLTNALRDVARNEDHAQQICDRIVRTQTRRCPLPGEFYQVADAIGEEARARTTWTPGAPKCAKCGDTGWILVKETYEGAEIDVAARCACRRAAAA